MSPPKNIKHAVFATWISIAINLATYGINKLTGVIGLDALLSGLVLCGLFCVFPVGFLNGRELSRFLYTGVTVMGYFLLPFVDTGALSSIDTACLLVTEILDVFIFYKLFSREASEWFNVVPMADSAD